MNKYVIYENESKELSLLIRRANANQNEVIARIVIGDETWVQESIQNQRRVPFA